MNYSEYRKIKKNYFKMEITEQLKDIILKETKIDLTDKKRTNEIVEYRAMYYSLVKELEPKYTLQRIGDSVNKNYATVIHSLKMYPEFEKYNKELKVIRKRILSYFKEPEEQTIQEQNDILKNEITNLKYQLHIKTKEIENDITLRLDSLLINTKGTEQNKIITERLEAFYFMNKNIRL
jgi:hypothetical protein